MDACHCSGKVRYAFLAPVQHFFVCSYQTHPSPSGGLFHGQPHMVNNTNINYTCWGFRGEDLPSVFLLGVFLLYHIHRPPTCIRSQSSLD